MTETAATAAGTAYRISGDGPPLVMVHGLGLNHAMWQWQRAALAAHFTVVEYDLLGHGNSPKPIGEYPMQVMLDQLIELMDSLDIDAAGLVGFSLGGLIVQAFTVAYPARVKALAILNAAHGRSDEERASLMTRVQQVREHGPSSTVDAALERWFNAGFADSSPEVLAQVRTWVIANDPRVYPELYRLLAHADIGLEESIRSINSPTIVITAEHDYGNSPEMSQRIASRISGSRLEILPGLRHMALAEDPCQLNALLVSFFSSALLPEQAEEAAL
ncbi:MAG: pimeloyl-ACP methyl ester carboxylesterase [Halieaceae bacterium]